MILSNSHQYNAIYNSLTCIFAYPIHITVLHKNTIMHLHHILFQDLIGTVETFCICRIMKLNGNIPAKKASQLNIAQCCQVQRSLGYDMVKDKLELEYINIITLELHKHSHTTLHKEMRKSRFIRPLKSKSLNQLKQVTLELFVICPFKNTDGICTNLLRCQLYVYPIHF